MGKKEIPVVIGLVDGVTTMAHHVLLNTIPDATHHVTQIISCGLFIACFL